MKGTQVLLEGAFSGEIFSPHTGAFFCPDIRAFTGLGRDLFNRFQSP